MISSPVTQLSRSSRLPHPRAGPLQQSETGTTDCAKASTTSTALRCPRCPPPAPDWLIPAGGLPCPTPGCTSHSPDTPWRAERAYITMLDLARHAGQVPLILASETSVVSTSFPAASGASSLAFFSPSSAAFSGDTPSTFLASHSPIPAPASAIPTILNDSHNPVAGQPSSTTDLAATSDTSPVPCDLLMQKPGRKCFGGFLALAVGYITLTGVGVHLNRGANESERIEDAQWVASSRNWVDRQACRWLGLCGTAHLNSNGWTWDGARDDLPPTYPDPSDYWTSGTEDPDSWSEQERELREIPQYVFDHAPYVHLFSGEEFWPCDLPDHLVHTSARVNYTKIWNLQHEMNLTNLHELNDYDGSVHGRYMYLQSDDNVEERPKWLGGAKNIPHAPETTAEGGEESEFWPGDQDLDGLERDPSQQQASVEELYGDGVEGQESSTLTPSENGRCGGGSGFTCKGSTFGQCCSIYGWCGTGTAYCGDACDALAGSCADPFEPVPRPHLDLRRRRLQKPQSNQHHPAGQSSAPALLFVVRKPGGIVDAFWFFFYSYNLGQKVLNIRFGNHVGDWEHTMIRFQHGKPTQVFLSEHNFGDAYAWHALEKYLPNPDGSGRMLGTWSNATAAKRARRPVVYSAVGSHAMYATPGLHPYVLPWGLLHDQTDRGPLWDPSLNVRSFVYDPSAASSHTALRASTRNPRAPTGWFFYAGHWGDKYYPLSDPRQYRFAGQYHYVNGPLGPRWKNLGRKDVCQGRGECRVRDWVGGDRARRQAWRADEDGEEGGLPGGNYTDDAFVL